MIYSRIVSSAIVAVLVAGAAFGQSKAPPVKDVDWPTYGADLAGSRYRPLDQINASNFNNLEVAWRFKTDSLGARPEFKLEGTPLEIDGVIYATAGTRRAVVALDAVTGELMWMHSEREGARGAAAPRQLSGRGLAYWTDGTEKRIVYVTPGYRLIALDAKTGQPIPGFGTDGMVDLKLDFDQTIQPDLTTGEVGLQSAPVVAGNTVIVGAAFREGMAPKTMKNNKGYVRAFDVRSGKRLWTFHTIPQKGEYGYETWLDGAADNNGNTGVWTQVTVDEELGLAYLPVESATGDFYGGHRPGNSLFEDSLVCVDLKTGVRKWHFQFTHHGLWDYDLASAPLLMDVTVGGKRIKAVTVPTKQGLLYTFDRVTGKPVWPIPEKPVEKGNVPGEWYSPTQPMPSKPPTYARAGIMPNDLVDFTPALHEEALNVARNFKLGPIFTPPVVAQQPGPRGTILRGVGGSNWPGGAFDPETHTVYLPACNACLMSIGLVPTPPGVSDMRYISGSIAVGLADTTSPSPTPPSRGAGAAPGAPAPVSLTVQGLPLVKPPYGTLTAIDMDKGDIKWQVAHGDTPDLVRNHPALKGLEIPRTGQQIYTVGAVVTKSLVIIGDGMITTTPEHPRGAMLRAYDKNSGKEVGAIWMPAPQSGSPMTYSVGGKQYLVVAISGGVYPGEYVAYALPNDD